LTFADALGERGILRINKSQTILIDAFHFEIEKRGMRDPSAQVSMAPGAETVSLSTA
jgi:hypothetical protein